MPSSNARNDPVAAWQSLRQRISERPVDSASCFPFLTTVGPVRKHIRRSLGEFRPAEYNQPFPHYEPAPDVPGLLVRIEADGTRTVGRFVNRQFREVD